MAKVKVATVWLEGCAGCHMSFLDIDEAIIELAKVVEFSRSPITDIKEFVPVDVGIVEGSVGNTEEEEVLKELRAHCKILMAWGDCACFGGVCAMRSSFDKKMSSSVPISRLRALTRARYPACQVYRHFWTR